MNGSTCRAAPRLKWDSGGSLQRPRRAEQPAPWERTQTPVATSFCRWSSQVYLTRSSSELCSFFALGEREFAARSQVLQSFGIKRYYRYRDDVLMICSRNQGTREFFKMLREKVQPFKLQVEEVSGSSIRYLDLLLTKTGTRFVARPAFKTTSLARPLDPTSAHPKFVHCSWPVGMVKRIFPLQRRAHFPLSGHQRFQVYHRTCCEGQSVAREEGSTCFWCFFCFVGCFWFPSWTSEGIVARVVSCFGRRLLWFCP